MTWISGACREEPPRPVAQVLSSLLLDACESAFEHGRQVERLAVARRRSPDADDAALRAAGQQALITFARAQALLDHGGG